jgi:hypothetical protein
MQNPLACVQATDTKSHNVNLFFIFSTLRLSSLSTLNDVCGRFGLGIGNMRDNLFLNSTHLNAGAFTQIP